jgi:hypothetical protein
MDCRYCGGRGGCVEILWEHLGFGNGLALERKRVINFYVSMIIAASVFMVVMSLRVIQTLFSTSI